MTAKVRILLVDDDPDIAWTLGRFLVRAGFAITTCTDGAEAIDLLESEEYDTLVTDIQMPRLNGLALIEWVRRNKPHIRVVVMTAFGSPSIQQVSLSKGAILYVEKPVQPDLLLDVLSAASEEPGITGSVTEIDLFDYIQLMIVTRRSALLEIKSREGSFGRIYLKEGDIPHAICDQSVGEEAFIRCLCFSSGRFSTLPWQEPEMTTISSRGDFLLMEAARKRDEAGWNDPAQCLEGGSLNAISEPDIGGQDSDLVEDIDE